MSLIPSEASARGNRRIQRSAPVTRYTTYYRAPVATATTAATTPQSPAGSEASTGPEATPGSEAATADGAASNQATASATATRVVTVSYDVSTAQGVANRMALYNRVGHFGGNPGYEGCGSGMSPQAAYNACCYSRSGMATVDVGYAQGRNGMWYCCRRYR